MSEGQKIVVTKGKAKSFKVFLLDKDGRPKSISGWTYVRVYVEADSGDVLELLAPVDVGVDEVQLVQAAAAPTSGTYKLKAGTEATAAIAFDATAADVQTALRALLQFSALTVAGASIQAGFTVSFVGADGKRNQPLLEVVSNGLVNLGGAVAIAVSVQTAGYGKRGVDVVSDVCGELEVFMNADDVGSLKDGLNQDIGVDVRIGSDDVDIPNLERVLDVKPEIT